MDAGLEHSHPEKSGPRAEGVDGADTRRRRAIGAAGTAARLIVGVWLVADVVTGHISGGFHLGSWLLGLVGFPAVLVMWQQARARRDAPPLRATGPLAHLLNIAVFLGLYLTFWYAPALEFTSDAALIFYGASMVLAAIRGYAGCEVLAVSNWLLRRDDQVGCAVFLPVDAAERLSLPPAPATR